MRDADRREDLQMLAKAGEVLYGENEESAVKEKGKKAILKRAWLQQMEIKRQEKEINDELLRLPKDRMSPTVNSALYESPIKSLIL